MKAKYSAVCALAGLVALSGCHGPPRHRAAELKAGAADWKLLLQLDSDEDTGWMWGDVGTIYFWVREQDARRGDFSKAWLVLQCS